jgi:hypothetical protein
MRHRLRRQRQLPAQFFILHRDASTENAAAQSGNPVAFSDTGSHGF